MCVREGTRRMCVCEGGQEVEVCVCEGGQEIEVCVQESSFVSILTIISLLQ